MVITKSDYDSGGLSPLDCEAYLLGLLEKPSGNYFSTRVNPFRSSIAHVATPGPDRVYAYSGVFASDAIERISKREHRVGWRGFGRRKRR